MWRVSPLLQEQEPEDRQTTEPRDFLYPGGGEETRARDPILQAPRLRVPRPARTRPAPDIRGAEVPALLVCGRPPPRGFTCRCGPHRRTLRASRLPCRRGSLPGRPFGSGGTGLPRERRRRCRLTSLVLQRPFRGCGSIRGRLAAGQRTVPALVGALGAAPRLLGHLSLCRRREIHARATRLGETDRDRLFGRTRTVFAFADVVYLLAHELSGLSGRCFAFAPVAPRPLNRFLLWHLVLPFQE
jgi:hypothetical protein